MAKVSTYPPITAAALLPADQFLVVDSTNAPTLATKTITYAEMLNAFGTGGVVPVNKGGTGQTTAQAAFDGLAPAQSGQGGKVLTTNGTTTSWGAITAGGAPGGPFQAVQSNNGSGGFTGSANLLSTGNSLQVIAGTSSSRGISVTGAAGQTAELQAWSSSTVLLSAIKADGSFSTTASAFVYAGVAYTWPSTQASSPGQVLTNNGAGALSWTTVAPAAGGASVFRAVAQTAHGFALGNVLAYTGTSYALARADTSANAEVAGIVAAVTDANNFTLLTGGYITGLSALTAGTVYFLSPTTSGALQATDVSTAGQISKPLLIADSTTSGYFVNWRGLILGASGGGAGGGGITGVTDPGTGTVNFDMSTADKQAVTLTGNRALTLTNDSVGQAILLLLTQDATGSRLVTTWPATIKWQGGTVPTLTTTPNKTDVISLLKLSGGNYLGMTALAF